MRGTRKRNAKANRRAKATRRLIIVDIENYTRKPVLTQQDVASARISLIEDLGIRNDDMVVIGTSHPSNYVNAQLAWKGPRHVGKWGHDGADKALIEAFDQYDLDTYSEVYVISGDGIFTDVANRVRAQNRPVKVVARSRAINYRLYCAADDVEIV